MDDSTKTKLVPVTVLRAGAHAAPAAGGRPADRARGQIVSAPAGRTQRLAAEVDRLMASSAAALRRGADAEHYAVYRSAVREAAQLLGGDGDWVARLRDDVQRSVERQADGVLRQSTYRRGIVDAVAAWLTVVASERAGRRVVVSPAEARRVVERSPIGFSEEGLHDPEEAIEAALRRDRRDDGPVDGDPPECEGRVAFPEDPPSCEGVATQRVTVGLGCGPGTYLACDHCARLLADNPDLHTIVVPLDTNEKGTRND